MTKEKLLERLANLDKESLWLRAWGIVIKHGKWWWSRKKREQFALIIMIGEIEVRLKELESNQLKND